MLLGPGASNFIYCIIPIAVKAHLSSFNPNLLELLLSVLK